MQLRNRCIFKLNATQRMKNPKQITKKKNNIATILPNLLLLISGSEGPIFLCSSCSPLVVKDQYPSAPPALLCY
jgi:hypothetical protein